MSENMVRTQVYLPREVHATLTRRAEAQGLTLADQIRAALDEDLARVQAAEAGAAFQPDDPLLAVIGLFDSGRTDLAPNHDQCLYGAARARQPVAAEAQAAHRPWKKRR